MTPEQYSCVHFDIRELVDPVTYAARGQRAWELFDPRALITLDALRKYFGCPMIVNSWKWGGGRQFSGFRPSDCATGATYSQHRMGRAFDCMFSNLTADEVREAIRAKPDLTPFQYISCIEEDVKWLHFDVRNLYLKDRIYFFHP